MGVYLVGVYLTRVHLMGVHLIACTSLVCTLWACTPLENTSAKNRFSKIGVWHFHSLISALLGEDPEEAQPQLSRNLPLMEI